MPLDNTVKGIIFKATESIMKDSCMPQGDLSGDDKAMPDKGTRTGASDTYGAATGIASTNSTPMNGADSRDIDWKRDDVLPIRQEQ